MFIIQKKWFFQATMNYNLERAVHKGKVAEDEICYYVNSIVAVENPSPHCEREWVEPDIHPQKKFKELEAVEFCTTTCSL